MAQGYRDVMTLSSSGISDAVAEGGSCGEPDYVILCSVRRDIQFETNISEYEANKKQVLFACFASKRIGGFLQAKRIKTEANIFF